MSKKMYSHFNYLVIQSVFKPCIQFKLIHYIWFKLLFFFSTIIFHLQTAAHPEQSLRQMGPRRQPPHPQHVASIIG